MAKQVEDGVKTDEEAKDIVESILMESDVEEAIEEKNWEEAANILDDIISDLVKVKEYLDAKES